MARATERSAARLWWLNGALLAALAVVTVWTQAGAESAMAQPGGGTGAGGQRNRGDYTMVSGRYQGGTSHAVFLLDASNQQILALKWDRTNTRFELVGLRSLTEDARVQGAPR